MSAHHSARECPQESDAPFIFSGDAQESAQHTARDRAQIASRMALRFESYSSWLMS